MEDKCLYKLSYYRLMAVYAITCVWASWYCCRKIYSTDMWVLILIISLIITLFAYFVSVTRIYDDKIVIKHPLRMFNRLKTIWYTECDAVIYLPGTTKTEAESLSFVKKDGTSETLNINLRSVSKKMLLFFESKGLRIEVKSAYYHSINDLK